MPLPPGERARVEGAALTYAETGATVAALLRGGSLPAGYHHVDRTGPVLGRGRADLDRLGEAVLSWQVLLRSGQRVAASAARAAPGVDVVARLGLGPAALRIPCRVVEVVVEERHVGFAYGTLPGHPEVGEEVFLLGLGDDGAVRLRVASFSRPAWRSVALAGAVARAAQARAVGRYLVALRGTARG